MGGGIGQVFGSKKFLWGNVPAFDVLQLESNEGIGFKTDLRLLFAASGDIRNVVKTIAQIPSKYNHSVHVTINDRDPEIVVRNVILLLIALVVEDPDEAVECIIHVWYSTLVRKSDIDLLQFCIRPLVEAVCEKVKDKRSDTILVKTWSFGQRSLRVALDKASWARLLSSLDIPEGLTMDRARETRAAIMMAESRKDYRARQLVCQSPSHRLALHKFRQDGLLLPFGTPRRDFLEPNPTFFQSDKTWPMKDNADPREGWSPEEVAKTSSGPAAADIYGKLFYHIRSTLHSFLSRLDTMDLCFELFQLDVLDLPKHLKSKTFSRIEVSNVADAGWLGIRGTLASMIPLLQDTLDNPHATLITLFMNAVDETLTDEDRRSVMTLNSMSTRRLLRYLPPNGAPPSQYDPRIIKFNLARDLVTTYDNIFDRYMKEFEFREASELFGAMLKENHTIIQPWPNQLKLQPGQVGAQEEFDRCMSAGLTSKERYVEWQRNGHSMLSS
ncbi:hypothetical protein S7711_01362 [Stachybotrys chartarum IBT 7711]|uniref:DUF4470 domain-containing protein n=1 Tax=Stachybotrys chartarum (strain CBS 109288 / IBT 7711) TaxID=1280523 RepID=A0A084BBU4_STACB|nr:hypothetical protein S7711_01362 [Stachybotrys chartarum IBT 7711]